MFWLFPPSCQQTCWLNELKNLEMNTLRPNYTAGLLPVSLKSPEETENVRENLVTLDCFLDAFRNAKNKLKS